MRTLGLTLGLLALAALGCKSNPNEALLERDLRMQEDRIYHLQNMVDDANAAREAATSENDSLKRQLAAGDIRTPARQPQREPVRKRNESPLLEAPSVELPGEASDGPTIEFAPPDNSVELSTGRPAEIVINRRLTGGLDRDGQDGDEGLMVVVEIRDAAGQLVKSPGRLSVVLMDPALPGSQARVARWDFSADEVPNHFHNTVFGNGLQFELPWPGEPPKNQQDLQLFVRFTTADGKKLNADTKLDIRAAREPISHDRQTQSEGAPSRSPRTPNSRLRTTNGPGGSPTNPSSAERNVPAATGAPITQ